MTAHLNRAAPYLLQAPTPNSLEKVQPRLADISSPSMVLGVLESCRISPGRLELRISAIALAEGLGVAAEDLAACPLTFTEAFQVRRRGVESRFVIGTGTSRTDEKLIRAVAIAHAWLEEVRSGVSMTAIAKRQNCTPEFIRQRMQLAFLSPAITAGILAGHQPPELTLTDLVAKGFSTDWDAQWAELGFAERA